MKIDDLTDKPRIHHLRQEMSIFEAKTEVRREAARRVVDQEFRAGRISVEFVAVLNWLIDQAK